MVTNEDRQQSRILDYLQSLALHGVSRQEARNGKGTNGVRLITPRSVSSVNTYLRRCKESGRHGDQPGACTYCAKAFAGISEEIKIEAPLDVVDLVYGPRDDQSTPDPSPPLDQWASDWEDNMRRQRS